MFRRFFVPLDGSPRAEKAIPVAASLARASSGSVILARVLVPPMHEEYGANIIANETQLIQSQEQSKASTYLNEVLERVLDALMRVTAAERGFLLLAEAGKGASSLIGLSV